MILESELQQLSIYELQKAIETKESELDTASDDLSAFPVFGGTPGQDAKAAELATKIEDGHVELKQMRDRLKELDPPAPKYNVFQS